MADFIELMQYVYGYLYSFFSSLIGEIYVQLIILTFSLFIYAVFVWKFYKTLSKRDIFKIDWEKYNLPQVKHKTLKKVFSTLAYIFKYGFIFPFYIFFWFLILSLFLLIMTENIQLSNILLTSIIIVSATRVTSYYKEELAVDLAKLIPFALLAISFTNPNFFSVETILIRISELPFLWSQVIQFLIFSIFLEWLLRILYLVKNLSCKKNLT